MVIDPSIFKSYDIRGIYPEQINETNIRLIARAIYSFFKLKIEKEKFNIFLAYDMRLSGPQLFDAVKNELLQMGADIIDGGQLSTPSFYFAVFNYKYDCGIQVTASHNPKNWNGMKFVLYSPRGLIKIGKPTGMDDVQKALSEEASEMIKTRGNVTKRDGILEDEVNKALDLLDNPNIKRLKIVADPGNAMGAQYVEALFEKIPGELIKMNFELDGSFPIHEPNPLKFETLSDLQRKVVEEKADLGIATDGDGDRLFFIDEKGKVVPSTSITSIVARELLKRYPGELIYFDIRDILGPQKIVEEFDGRSEIVRVGHAYITEAMNKTGGIFAGESSGHMFFRANGNAEWNLPVILIILKVISEENRTLSDLVEELRRSYEMPEYNFEVSNASEILNALREKYKEGKFWDIDGVSISYIGWRFNVRTSNTEPLLRLNVEGYSKIEVEEKFSEIKDFIKSVAR
ncbi:MAG: Phosphomannomutase [Candidatus Giovannonibacteria bacterium GW2011_GWA1_44_25]|uniref:Phosphomannomutase n=1 Tax=Candidatus Giovannonibacteria bacterium GW2011_GWA1_44_25 TaxID=1618645 RepID=A0A0G1LG46_9BACT|nr:MAG: Phosphomannomutase [Candidatus Giovannonibacteria bacterium GW2011_GWA1_44_25]